MTAMIATPAMIAPHAMPALHRDHTLPPGASTSQGGAAESSPSMPDVAAGGEAHQPPRPASANSSSNKTTLQQRNVVPAASSSLPPIATSISTTATQGANPPPLRTRKSHNNSSSKLSMDVGPGGIPHLRSVRVGNHGGQYPSPFTRQDSQNHEITQGPPAMHHVAYPYMLYPLASPMASCYALPDAGSPHASPSPLMGSPVGTPTAMMFPQTPFAGAHASPFNHFGGGGYTDGQLSPHASGRVSYFHPMFNNFPFMGLQSLASVPQPGAGLPRTTSIQQPHAGQGAGPAMEQAHSGMNKQGQGAHTQGTSGSNPATGPEGITGFATAGPDAQFQTAGLPMGLLMPQPSYGLSSLQLGMNMTPQVDESGAAVQTDFADGALLSGMFSAMHLHPYSQQAVPMYMPVADPVQLQQLLVAQQAALAQLQQQQQSLAATGVQMTGGVAATDFSHMTEAQARGLQNAAAAASYAMMLPSSPTAGNTGTAAWPSMAAMPAMAASSAAMGMPAAAGSSTAAGVGNGGFELWDLSSMYGMALGLGQPAVLQSTHADMYSAGLQQQYGLGAEQLAAVQQAAGLQRKSRLSNAVSPAGQVISNMNANPGFGGFPMNMMHLSATRNLPHIATHAVGSPTVGQFGGAHAGLRVGRFGGPGSGGTTSPGSSGYNKGRRNTNGTAGSHLDAAAIKTGPDGLPRLNARQRRTLRRAKERAIKGLMEAGRLLLQRAAGSQSGRAAGQAESSGTPAAMVAPPSSLGSVGPEDEKSGSEHDADKTEAGSCSPAADMATTNYYFQAAMQVARGSHGPEAAADATSVLTQVAAELEDMDLAALISQLSSRKDEGAAGVDDSLIRDLQIIQNLMGALRSPTLNNSAGTAAAAVSSTAAVRSPGSQEA